MKLEHIDDEGKPNVALEIQCTDDPRFRMAVKRVSVFAGRLERIAAELRHDLEIFDANPELAAGSHLRELPKMLKGAREALESACDGARAAGFNIDLRADEGGE